MNEKKSLTNWGLLIIITSIVYLNFTPSKFLNISSAQESSETNFATTVTPTPGCDCNPDGSCSGHCNSLSGENRQCRPSCNAGCWCPNLNDPTDVKDIGTSCKVTDGCPTATPTPTATPKNCICKCREPSAPPGYDSNKEFVGGTCTDGVFGVQCYKWNPKTNTPSGSCVGTCSSNPPYTYAVWGTCGPWLPD